MSDRVEFEIRPDDLEAFLRHYEWRGPVLGWVRLGVTILAPTLWALWTGLPPLVVLPTALLLAGLGLGIRRLALRHGLRRFLASRGQSVLGDHQLTLEPTGLRERSPAGETFDLWGVVERLDEGQDHLFLYNRRLYCFVVPMRAFPDRAQALRFLEEARHLHRLAGG